MQGQIIKRGDNTHLVRVFMGRSPVTGKRLYHNHTVHGTRKDARRYLNGVLHQKDMGAFVQPSRVTLDSYLDQWLADSARPRLRARTAYEYEKLLKRYVRPVLGARPLSEITPLDLQSLYTKMLSRGLSARTVRYTHAVVSSALKQALKWRLLAVNPAMAVDLPRLPKKEMHALSPEEVRRLFDAAVGTRFETLFQLAVTTGMRPGEYLGLKWQDVDFAAGAVIVQRVLERHKGGWTFGEPKTAKSRRSIPLPGSVVNLLASHKRTQAEQRMANAADYTDHDLVFATASGLPLDKHNLVHFYFKPLLKAAKLPMTTRLYDLRHTCATLLLAGGENPKVVSERLGHASIVLTMDVYSHVLPTMQEAATARLEAMLFRRTAV